MGNHPSKDQQGREHMSPLDSSSHHRDPRRPNMGPSHSHRVSSPTSPTSPSFPPGVGRTNSGNNADGSNFMRPQGGTPAGGYRPGLATTPSNSSNTSGVGQVDRSSGRRPSRTDISIFGIAPGRGPLVEFDPSSPDARKETRAEREARKLAKEREARKIERERSIREENVDGGYLVTLGTYTGTEDFSKQIVRQLMIERRLAPFWKGLNDYDEDWADNQIVAAVRGLPIPEAEENPSPIPESNDSPIATQLINVPNAASPNDTPIPSPSYGQYPPSPISTTASQPMSITGRVEQSSTPTSPSSSVPNSSSGMLPPFFRGRAKTLASTITNSFTRSNSQPELGIVPPPPEIRLAADPLNVNGRAIEAVLYKEQLDCPICFLGYPPFLNKTRCCDQPICSECFVQIKRPDPHPPEHHGDEPGAPPGQDPVAAAAAAAAGNEEFTLVSEPATCPYCKMPEFGITYEPPPFRRGLAYATSLSTSHYGHSGSHSNMNHLLRSAMSSSSSINSSVHSSNHPAQGATPVGGASTPTGSTATRHRRNQSVSADAPSVITTDRIRPDWAKKLADMRAHALRRAAAATALHNAAYMLGNLEAHGYGRGESSRGGIGMFRRRRGLFSGNPGAPGAEDNGLAGFLANNAPRHDGEEGLPGRGAGGIRSGSTGDLFPGRMSSMIAGAAPGGGTRRSRMEDLEELMMMEAIRQSIAAEEERKRREDAEKAKKEQEEREKAGASASRNGTSSGSLPSLTTSIPTVGTVVPPSAPHSAVSATYAHPLSISMSPETTSSARSSTSDLQAPGAETSGSSPSPMERSGGSAPLTASTTVDGHLAPEGKGKQVVLTNIEHRTGPDTPEDGLEDKAVEGKGKGKEPVLGV